MSQGGYPIAWTGPGRRAGQAAGQGRGRVEVELLCGTPAGTRRTGAGAWGRSRVATKRGRQRAASWAIAMLQIIGLGAADRTPDHGWTFEVLATVGMSQARPLSARPLFMLGKDLSWVRYGKADQVESFKVEARDIADFIGFSGPVEIFLESPYLRPVENPPPDGGDPMPGLRNAVTLRYAQEGLAAFMAGSTLGAVLNLGLPGGKFPPEAVSIFKKAIGLLYLPPEASDNMLRAIKELESGASKPRDFLWYLVLFSMYLTYRMTGDSDYVVPLFETRASLAEPSTVAQVKQLMKQIAAGGPPGTREPSSSPGNATSDSRQSESAPE